MLIGKLLVYFSVTIQFILDSQLAFSSFFPLYKGLQYWTVAASAGSILFAGFVQFSCKATLIRCNVKNALLLKFRESLVGFIYCRGKQSEIDRNPMGMYWYRVFMGFWRVYWLYVPICMADFRYIYVFFIWIWLIKQFACYT